IVPRTLKMSFGVEPSEGPDVEIYSTPLMLRWIARWTSDCIRSGIEARSRPARSKPAVAFISALRLRAAGAWCAAAATQPDRSCPAQRIGRAPDVTAP